MMKMVLNLIEGTQKRTSISEEFSAKLQLSLDSRDSSEESQILKSTVVNARDDRISNQSTQLSPAQEALRIPEILSLILAHLTSSSPAILDPYAPIDFARADSTKFSMTAPKLLSASYVNKLWNRIATPLMYKNSRLGTSRACDLLTRTLRSPSVMGHDYGSMIDAFVVILPFSNQGTENWNIDQVVYTIAQKCPNLQKLNLADCKNVTDVSVIAIARNCKKLNSLNLNRCAKVTSGAIEELANAALPLQSLHLCRPLVDAQELLSDRSIARLISVSPELRVLRLRSCNRITDLTVAQIAKTCPELMALDLSWCGRITDQSMAVLGQNCKKIRSIALNGCRLLSDRSIRSLLSNSKEMQSLSLAHLPFATDAVLTEMAPALRNLNILSLNGCAEVSDNSIVAIVNACTRLESLSLFSINISDLSMTAITSRCTALQSFSISGCERVTDAGASLIQNLRSLTSLYLNTRSISDASIVAISQGCRSIRALSLNDCVHVTTEGILAIAEANEDLISLSIDKTQITIEGMSQLTQKERLREISAKECERLIDEAALKELRKGGRIAITVSTSAALARLQAQRMLNEASQQQGNVQSANMAS